MTRILADKMYSHLDRKNLLPSEWVGCHKGSCGTKDQLLIDKTLLRDCKRRDFNLAMAWIDYIKTYDMVPHSWISECFETLAIPNNVRDFLNNNVKSWKLELNRSEKKLGEIDIRRGIFQGNSLSLLLFVSCMVPSNKSGNKRFKLNHWFSMDELK